MTSSSPLLEGRVILSFVVAVCLPIVLTVHDLSTRGPWKLPDELRHMPSEGEASREGKASREGEGAGAPGWPEVKTLLIFTGEVCRHRRQAGGDFDASLALLRPALQGATRVVAPLLSPIHPERRRARIPEATREEASTKGMGGATEPGKVSRGSGKDASGSEALFEGNEAFLRALARAGITHCNLATSHAFSLGREGLDRTIRELKEAGLGVLGVAPPPAPTEEEARPFLETMPAEGRQIATVAATWKVKVPALKDFSAEPPPLPRAYPIPVLPLNDWVDDLAAYGRARLAPLTRAGHGEGIDTVVALLDWGRVWDGAPLPGGEALLRERGSLGLDLIIGTGSHVPGPYRAPGPEGGAAVTSLGLLLSDHRLFPGRVGGLCYAGFPPTGPPRLGILPVLVFPSDGWGRPLHLVCPLDETRKDEVLTVLKGKGIVDGREQWAKARSLARHFWGPVLLAAPPRIESPAAGRGDRALEESAGAESSSPKGSP